MNRFEAKQLLRKRGYKLIKEAQNNLSDHWEYEGKNVEIIIDFVQSDPSDPEAESYVEVLVTPANDDIYPTDMYEQFYDKACKAIDHIDAMNDSYWDGIMTIGKFDIFFNDVDDDDAVRQGQIVDTLADIALEVFGE